MASLYFAFTTNYPRKTFLISSDAFCDCEIRHLIKEIIENLTNKNNNDFNFGENEENDSIL